MQLIDAGMIAFSAWHALKKRVEYPLTFQVPRMLRKIIQETEDTYALFWNDTALWKEEKWPPYRDRLEIWEEAGELDYQSMIRVLDGLGVVQFRTATREADELLAAVAHVVEGHEPIVIRSDDKDFMQLLTETTAMLGRVRGTVTHLDVEPKLGVPPEYVADFLALTGDKVDGIPTIVTPAPARKLIARYGHILDWIDQDVEATDGVKAKLVENRDQLLLNLELVDLGAKAVGHPPPPLESTESIADIQELGRDLKVTYLTEASLAEDFAILRTWGDTTRRILATDYL